MDIHDSLEIYPLHLCCVPAHLIDLKWISLPGSLSVRISCDVLNTVCSLEHPCSRCLDGKLPLIGKSGSHCPEAILKLEISLNNWVSQHSLSQDLETGCLKLAVVTFLGVQMFKGAHNILLFQP